MQTAGLCAERPGSVVWAEGLRCRNMEAKRAETGQEIALSGCFFLEVVRDFFGDVAGMVPDPLQVSRDENIGNHGL